MQNFLFRKNSHSASVVAKALPRLPESPPSPAIRPRLGLRLAHPTNRRRQPPSHGPPPPKTGVPQKQRRENARKPECRDANGPRHRRNAPRQAGTPLRRRTKPQDAAICRSPSDVWADGASERIRRFAAECRSDTSQSSCKSVGRGRMLSAASENPPPRPRSSGGRDRAPARLPRRSGEEADGSVFRPRPEAATPCGKTGTVGRMCKPLTRTGQKNVRTNPDTPTGTPSRRIRHTPDTRQTPHTRQTRTSRDEPRTTRLRHGNDMPHTTEQLPDNQPVPDKQPCRERPHRTATNTVGSFGRDKSHNPERPFSSSAPPVTMPSTLPDTTFAAPAGYNARNLAEYNARSPAGYDAPASPDTTFAAPPDTAFPHRSRTIPSTPLRPVRYKSGTAAARTAESRSKL